MRNFGKKGDVKVFNATIGDFGARPVGRRFIPTICLKEVWTDFRLAADHLWLTDNVGVSRNLHKGDKVCFFGKVGTYRGKGGERKQNIYGITNFHIISKPRTKEA